MVLQSWLLRLSAVSPSRVAAVVGVEQPWLPLALSFSANPATTGMKPGEIKYLPLAQAPKERLEGE